MDDITFVKVNGPVSVMAILTNIFFCYCLLYPGKEKEVLKQPLKALLISLVAWNFCLHITTVLSIILVFFPAPVEVHITLIFICVLSAFSIMSCGTWLRLFYYTKIVPAQRAFFVWIKRNIKAIVYSGLVVDRLFLSLELFYAATTFSSLKNLNSTLSSMNETIIRLDNALYSTGTFSVLQLIYVIFFIGTMALSGVATLVYLCRHMKRMEMSDSPFSSSRVKTHMRVALMGIIQTCLHAICFLLILLGWFHIEYHLAGYRVVQTVYSLFSFGTIVNLGFGQSLLRHRAADIFDKTCQIIMK